VYGSLERFIGILIEHYAGAFPTWLAPVQVRLLPVNNNFHLDYTHEVKKQFEALGIRVEIDQSEEKLGYRIRQAQVEKIPYSVVIGDKERDERLLTYRLYGSQVQTTVSLQELLTLIKKEIDDVLQLRIN
jgi:threonyl-tRNA synthetase